MSAEQSGQGIVRDCICSYLAHNTRQSALAAFCMLKILPKYAGGKAHDSHSFAENITGQITFSNGYNWTSHRFCAMQLAG